MEIRRKVKNVVYKYSEPERLVREATSNDPWGPTSTVMAELSELSYDAGCCEEMMIIIWKRLNDKGKNWRHVYKCLVLLDYLIKCGDQRVATVCLNNIHAIETLKDFQYFEEHKDLGLGVREKSKSLVILLKDSEVLSIERQKGQKIKEKFQGPRSALGSHQRRRPGDLGKEIRKEAYGRDHKFPKSVMKLNFDESKNDDEDADLQKAIALSKEEHELSMKKKMEDERREEIKLKMALEQSKKEDEALAVLRLPPKNNDTTRSLDLLSLSTVSSQQKPLYKFNEPSKDLDEINGFGELDNHNYDPWGSSTVTNSNAAVTLSFDPWKTDNNLRTEGLGNGTSMNSGWQNTKSVQNKNIIDDIFGEEKPNIRFESSWSENYGNEITPTKMEKENQLLDVWEIDVREDTFGFNKNKTGSLASLTDIDTNQQDDKIQHSCSVMNLASNITKKTPQEFLGENANLVNLDNLLPAPKAGVYRDASSYAQKNPFGLSSGVTNNPFNSQNIIIKKPMNQMGSPASQSNMFSSSGNVTSSNVTANYNVFPQMPQPMIPNSQSQFHGFPVNNNPYNSGANFWAPQPPLVPSNQWATNSNNVTSNPFF